MRSFVLAVLPLLVVATIASAGSPVEVTTCGQEVRGKAFLSGDLDCTASTASIAVRILRGSLDLGGFTITGGPNQDIDIVRCVRSCTIFGGGTLRGGFFGVHGTRRVRLFDTGSALFMSWEALGLPPDYDGVIVGPGSPHPELAKMIVPP